MHLWRIKGRRPPACGVTVTIPKRVPLPLLFWGILGIGSVLLFSLATIAGPNATGSNMDEATRGQAGRDAPPGMAWIPGGTFLMGTNEKESFPNERPAHLVQVQGFWMDEHDVTNAEFSKFVEATGYVTTAERKIDWEELKKELAPGTPKPDDSALAPGALVFTPTAGPVPLNDLSAWWRWVWPEQTGDIPKAHRALSREEKIIQSFRSRGTTRLPMLNGLANGCPRKLSGNSLPAAAWKQNDTSGATNSSPAANTWPIPGRDYSLFETVAKMVL
jgi:hypothetical protein